jgi:uncharacterized membrane protein YkgB
MGLKVGDFPPVDPATFTDAPYLQRIRTLATHWAEYGFGAPKITHVIYIARLIVFYMIGGILVATLTSHLNPLHFDVWWKQPVVYQKFVLWTAMLETIGFAGSWGPLAGHFKPMTGGILYYARPGTIRVPPWPGKVPFTSGDERKPVDVALYVLLLVAFVLALALPGHHGGGLANSPGKGRVAEASILPIIILLVVLGLRDKVVFLAARSEQYIPAMLFFAFFPFVDMIVAAKIFIVIVWFGASFSKVTRHFALVIPPMVSNTPWLSSKRIKRTQYRAFPEDLRPAKAAVSFAHGLGTLVEMGAPLVLLFSHNHTVTVCAAILMMGFHFFITSTFPLAVPLEWNVLFGYITAFLFLGYPNNHGYGLGNIGTGPLLLTLAGCLFLPILGNLRPDLVSFLPSMRQYSGNWATAMWAFAPGREAKLNEHIVKPALMQKEQLTAIYGEEVAEVVMHQLLGFRSLHSQARGLNSVMINQLGEDINTYTPREAEFSCNALLGFNFGDGHFHNQNMINALQKRCQFAPGEFIVVWVESEAVFNGRQYYWVMDAAIGEVERGSWSVAEAVEEQPWLPNGPIATNVTWRREGYTRVRHPGGFRPPAPQAVGPEAVAAG